MGADQNNPDLTHGADTSWTPCPPGAMRQVVYRLRAKKRWSIFSQAGAAVAVMLAAAVGLWFAVDRYIYGGFESTGAYGMTCAEVQELLPDYVAGRLDDEQVADLERHLHCCGRCDIRYRELGGTKVFAAADELFGLELHAAAFTPPAGVPCPPHCCAACDD